ncbi:MAG TPA: hypothetical protein DCY89_08330 [Gammaproteobacteria bacterium]|nr:hypothetical protein [Gammaproteobacteria bacterium]
MNIVSSTLPRLVALVSILPATPAFAVISTGSGTPFGDPFGTPPEGELFFIAHDPVSNNTFVKDLGYDFFQIVANSNQLGWFAPINLGALVTPGTGAGQFNFGPNVRWNLAAQTRVSANHARGNNGVITTVNVANSTGIFDASRQAHGGVGTNLTNAANRLDQLQSRTSNKIGFLNQLFPSAATPDRDNDEHYVADPASNQAYDFVWGGDLSGQASGLFSSQATSIDQELALFYFYRTTGPVGVRGEQFAGVFRLSADGVLTHVPVPPAIWLLGSALLGLGYRRRQGTPVLAAAA